MFKLLLQVYFGVDCHIEPPIKCFGWENITVGGSSVLNIYCSDK